MARRFFNDGQEVLLEDLNGITQAIERGLFDRYIHQMIGRVSDAFFGDSFKVVRTDSDTISITAGLGIQNDTSQASPEPTKRPLVRDSDLSLDIETPHASLNRIDIVVVKAALADEITTTRRFKDADTDEITDESMVVQKDWQADCQIIEGTPHDSPSAPATPAGYLRIASLLVTASTGMGTSAVTDERSVINQASASGYDAIVGSGGTHATLAAAIAAASAGWKILVISNETISAGVVIDVANIQIDFKPGVTLSKGGSATEALDIDGVEGVRINGGRISGFNAGGNAGIRIRSDANYAMIRDTRFDDCTAAIDDSSSTSSIVGTLEE